MYQGVALVMFFFQRGDFSAKLHQIAMLSILTNLSQLGSSKLWTDFLENWKDVTHINQKGTHHRPQGQDNQTVYAVNSSQVSSISKHHRKPQTKDLHTSLNI